MNTSLLARDAADQHSRAARPLGCPPALARAPASARARSAPLVVTRCASRPATPTQCSRAAVAAAPLDAAHRERARQTRPAASRSAWPTASRRARPRRAPSLRRRPTVSGGGDAADRARRRTVGGRELLGAERAGLRVRRALVGQRLHERPGLRREQLVVLGERAEQLVLGRRRGIVLHPAATELVDRRVLVEPAHIDQTVAQRKRSRVARLAATRRARVSRRERSEKK